MSFSYIKTANKLFSEGDFSEALKYYKIASNSSVGRKVNLTLNISLCEKKLGLGNSLIPKKGHDASTFYEKESILSMNVEDLFLKKNKVDNENLVILYKYVKESHKNIDLSMLLKVLIGSPFQISILFITAYYMIDKSYLHLLEEDDDDSIKIKDLIRAVYDHVYWMRKKGRILELMNKLNVSKNDKYLNNDFKPFIFDSISSFSEAISFMIDLTDKQVKNNTSLNHTPLKAGHNDLKVSASTIMLNEAKFIGLNLINHYELCDEWVLVEGTCKGYPDRKVTKEGFSLDSTAVQVILYPDRHNKIRYIRYGWTSKGGEDAKSELRNQYLRYIKGDVLWVIDADEFYSPKDVHYVMNKFQSDRDLTAYTLPQVHFWKGLNNFIIGGYYDISHTRFFKNIPGMKYVSNHNFPEINKIKLNQIKISKHNRVIKDSVENSKKYEGPRCYHLGFAKDADDMADKTQYYLNRGEEKTRKKTTASRAGWFNDDLPVECKIMKWGGHYPKVLTSLK